MRKKVGKGFGVIGEALVNGDWKTRLSFLIMGFGLFSRKQFFRGFLLFCCQIAFTVYFSSFGWKYLSKITTLGTVASREIFDETLGIFTYEYYDNSLLILLYSMLTILFALVHGYLWNQSVKASYCAQRLLE